MCGTSTGAILALGLATGRTSAQLTALYKELGSSVFRSPRLGRGYGFRARWNNRPLRAALEKEFGEATLGDVFGRGKCALVTTFNLTEGKPRLFKTDHAAHLTMHGGIRVSDVALASSAAPFYFPAVPITNPANRVTELYCDGGVVANHPALLGFSEAVSDLKRPPGSLRILSLSTPASDIGEGTGRLWDRDRSILRWGAKLPAIFVESGASIADQLLRRLIGALPADMRPVYERIEMRNREKHPMDCASPAATRALMHEGATLSSDNAVRAKVQSVIS